MNRLIIGSPDKSALLLTLMAEDFDNGFTLIDPTGELAEAAADRAPVQRTFYLDPSDIRHPPGFNVFDDVPLDDRHKIAEDMCAYFEAMWPNGWGARSGYIFLNCLRLLLDTPGSTFLGMPKLLTDGSYRAKCLKHCTDPVVLNFWCNEFADWDDRFRKDAIAPLQNKLGALLTSPLIRNILGQRHSTFSLETSIDRAQHSESLYSGSWKSEAISTLCSAAVLIICWFGKQMVVELHRTRLAIEKLKRARA